MSDVTVAQPSAAPEPVANEVPINENPINSQNAVGDQTVAREHDHAAERRKAIDDAYERANKGANERKPAQKPAPKAAEAKAGHNRPPEETEKFDLKKRPGDQPRGDRGQFASRETGQDRSGVVNAGQADQRAKGNFGTQPQSSVRTLPEGAPFRDPPGRISDRARQDWDHTPESVRGDVHRMHHEFNQAYQRYRGDHETMNSIRPYHEMATQHNTTLGRALSNYVTMEQKLRADPVAGLDLIVHNLNLVDPQSGRRLGLRDLAYHVLTQTPEQMKMTQQGNIQSAAAQQIGALHQKLDRLEQYQQQMHNQQQYSYTRSAVDQYADSHPRLDDLADLIEYEINLGFDLDTAYRRAELLRPARAAQTRTTSAQTRPTDRSISGAPVSPSNGAGQQRRGPPPSRRDALEHAYRHVVG